MHRPVCWHSWVHLGTTPLLSRSQVLLSQVHRLRALDLLGRFLDLGPWAVSLVRGPLPCPPLLPPALPAASRPCSDTAQPLVLQRKAEATKDSKGVPGRGSEQLVQCPRQSKELGPHSHTRVYPYPKCQQPPLSAGGGGG